MLKNILIIHGVKKLNKYEQYKVRAGREDTEGCYQQGNLCCVLSSRGEVCREGAICNRGIVCTTHHLPR